MNLKQNANSYGRFKDLPWFEDIVKAKVFIGGAGGIGSNLCFQLARTGAKITIVDTDTVDETNLGGQLYGKEEIGKKKIWAISDVINKLCGENNTTLLDTWIDEKDGPWKKEVAECDIVCVGFDNLDARRFVYEEWRKNGKKSSLFLDGRLTAESGQIYWLDKASKKSQHLAYQATYFDESERTELPCTMKATTHCGMLIASLMTSNITNWINNQNEANTPRDIANFEFHLPVMIVDQPFLTVKKDVA